MFSLSSVEFGRYWRITECDQLDAVNKLLSTQVEGLRIRNANS